MPVAVFSPVYLAIWFGWRCRQEQDAGADRVLRTEQTNLSTGALNPKCQCVSNDLFLQS